MFLSIDGLSDQAEEMNEIHAYIILCALVLVTAIWLVGFLSSIRYVIYADIIVYLLVMAAAIRLAGFPLSVLIILVLGFGLIREIRRSRPDFRLFISHWDAPHIPPDQRLIGLMHIFYRPIEIAAIDNRTIFTLHLFDYHSQETISVPPETEMPTSIHCRQSTYVCGVTYLHDPPSSLLPGNPPFEPTLAIDWERTVFNPWTSLFKPKTPLKTYLILGIEPLR